MTDKTASPIANPADFISDRRGELEILCIVGRALSYFAHLEMTAWGVFSLAVGNEAFAGRLWADKTWSARRALMMQAVQSADPRVFTPADVAALEALKPALDAATKGRNHIAHGQAILTNDGKWMHGPAFGPFAKGGKQSREATVDVYELAAMAVDIRNASNSFLHAAMPIFSRLVT